MAQAREVVPVMDEKVATPKAKSGRKASAATRKGLGGIYGASFTGEGTRGRAFRSRSSIPSGPRLIHCAWSTAW